MRKTLTLMLVLLLLGGMAWAENGKIVVKFLNSKGSPVSNWPVRLLSGSMTIAQANTDGAGICYFDAVKQKTSDLLVSVKVIFANQPLNSPRFTFDPALGANLYFVFKQPNIVTSYSDVAYVATLLKQGIATMKTDGLLCFDGKDHYVPKSGQKSIPGVTPGGNHRVSAFYADNSSGVAEYYEALQTIVNDSGRNVSIKGSQWRKMSRFGEMSDPDTQKIRDYQIRLKRAQGAL